LACPDAESDAVPSYAMNRSLSGAKVGDIRDPAGTILFFEVDESGRPEARHKGGMNCGFVDGHVKRLKGGPPASAT